MFVNKTENKTETNNKVWLVIEKNYYGSSRSSYTVSKHTFH